MIIAARLNKVTKMKSVRYMLNQIWRSDHRLIFCFGIFGLMAAISATVALAGVASTEVREILSWTGGIGVSNLSISIV